MWILSKNWFTILSSLRNLNQKSLLSTKNGTKFFKDDSLCISLCIIGNGAGGNSRSLFLNYHDQYFMFNCGEGSQRLLSDLGLKSSKIEAFFTTSNQWSNVSGLASLLLSRYDSGCKEFNVYSRYHKALIRHCTTFDTKLKKIKYKFFDETKNFVHNKLTLKSFSIQIGNIKTMVYLGYLSSEKGSVNLEKCFRLKVPRNLVSELERYESVVNKEGRTIHPSDVLDSDSPEQKFIIFECVKPNYLDELFQNDLFNNFVPRCDVIVHFTRDEYLKEKNYQDFLQKFKTSHHLLITESNPSLSLYSTHRFQIQLNYLDSKLFPLLKNLDEIGPSKLPLDGCDKIIRSQTGLEFIIRSTDHSKNLTLNLENVPKAPTLSDALFYKDGTERDGLHNSVNELKIKQSSLPTESRFYPEFVFLGTASSLSLAIRNVSVILVNLNEKQSILMECGENTYGQLLNFYGGQRIGEILKNIKAIFVSHHHSDHHLGLVNLLEKQQQYSSDKLWILLPPMVHQFLTSNIFHINTPNRHFVVNNNFMSFKRKIINYLNVNDMELIPVNHCAYAYGITITDRNNFKFVYSGDTQPCDDLIKNGANCDLLIHEATVEDGLVQFARNNFHSTMSEAINVGRSMNAGFTMLTHFSQRYGKLPFIPDDHPNVGIAFDNMRMNPSEFNRIPLLYEPLKCMYAKHLDRIKYRSDIYIRKYSQ